MITYAIGFTKPNLRQLDPKNRKIVESNGGKILTTAHVFGTLGRIVNKNFVSLQVDRIVSAVFRLFGQVVKVSCEVACMAADVNLIKTGEETVSIRSIGRGADTAVVLKPSNTRTFFDLIINEIVCKPRF